MLFPVQRMVAQYNHSDQTLLRPLLVLQFQLNPRHGHVALNNRQRLDRLKWLPHCPHFPHFPHRQRYHGHHRWFPACFHHVPGRSTTALPSFSPSPVTHLLSASRISPNQLWYHLNATHTLDFTTPCWLHLPSSPDWRVYRKSEVEPAHRKRHKR
jgi:hypothetical protein